jgi:hypothetical protein
VNVDYLYRRGQLRKACKAKGAHFESWLAYARDLAEFHGRPTRIAYQAAIHHVEQGIHFCDWRLLATSVGILPQGVRLVHTCRKATGHTGAHFPITPLTLYCPLWWRGTEPPICGDFPTPRPVESCRRALVPAMPEAAAGIKAVFDHLDELTPDGALNTARGGLSRDRIDRLLRPDPKRRESPMKPRRGKK